MEMRAGKILLFFIAVISSFCTAGFTGDARGAAISRTESALVVHEVLTGDFGVSPLSGARNGQGNHTSEVFKVISVLEGRIEDPKLIQRVKDKLSALTRDRLRMAVSLSERITEGDRGVETDIAFFLLTTLIVLS
jgi:hypothetical protein